MNFVLLDMPVEFERRRIWTTLFAVLVAAFAVPLGAILVGGAEPVRILFPVYTFVIALWLQIYYRTVLPSFIIALFAFSPFLRRLADYNAGFELISPVLLGPYFALLPTLPSFMRRALGQRSGPTAPFLILAICIAYAVFLCLPQSHFLAGANELIRWLLPISLCTFIMERPDDARAIKRSLLIMLVCVLPILTIYGIEQYVNPQIWDVVWMKNTRNAGISGLPFPYQVRVYSMMNSAMSLAVFVASSFILMAGEGVFCVIIGALALPVLALTMDRQAWVQCAIGAVLLVIQAPSGRRIALTFGVVIVSLGALGVLTGGLLPPLAQNELDQRFATFSNLSTDTSADERIRTYSTIYDRFADSPLGEGFGVNGSTAAGTEKRTMVPLDSSVLEIGLTFGVVMGPLFAVTIAGLSWMAFKTRKWDPDRLMGGPALVFSILITSPLGSNIAGEGGIMTWTALGILLSDPSLRWSRTAMIRQSARFNWRDSPAALDGTATGERAIRTGT